MAIPATKKTGWGTHEVAKMVGVSPRQVRYWKEKGLLTPSHILTSRGGGFRFDLRDLLIAFVIKELKDRGLSFYRIRKSVERVRESWGLQHPLAEMRVACLAQSVVFKSGSSYVDALSGQQVFEAALHKIELHTGKKRARQGANEVRAAARQVAKQTMIV